MEKKNLISRFIAIVYLFGFPGYNYVVAQNGFDNYITISNGNFMDGDTMLNHSASTI